MSNSVIAMFKFFKKTNAPRFITRFDIFILILLVSLFLTAVIAVKYVFQKEQYVTVELLATGGEWWWGVPPPYYWNFPDLGQGAIEYDVFRKPLVEIIETKQYGHDIRKFAWIKARLKVTKNTRTGALTFRQFPLQVGKTVTISPNNIMVIANVVSIEGYEPFFNQKERIITAKLLEKRDWIANSIVVGDVMLDNNGEVIAEILEKTDEPAETITVNWLGEPLLKRDPLYRDITLKIRLKVLQSKDGFEYFNFYQLIQPGTGVNIQLSRATIEPHILTVE